MGEEAERQPSPLLASNPPPPVRNTKFDRKPKQYTRSRICPRYSPVQVRRNKYGWVCRIEKSLTMTIIQKHSNHRRSNHCKSCFSPSSFVDGLRPTASSIAIYILHSIAPFGLLRYGQRVGAIPVLCWMCAGTKCVPTRRAHDRRDHDRIA